MLNNNNQIVKLTENNFNNIQSNEISLSFVFSKRDINKLYLNVKESSYFREVIKELQNKYSFLKDIEIDYYLFNGNIIYLNKTVKENGLKQNSEIVLIEKDS